MSSEYVPPKVWTWELEPDAPISGNRPTAGARLEKTLPKGEHPLQLYSLATPNGQKIGIFLEELLAAGVTGAEYDAWLIHIGKGDQFGSDYVKLNPNSKIPAMYDYSDSKDEPVQLFETGSILYYLAQKFGDQHPFFPKAKSASIMNWLFWQVGSAPYVGGGFKHFYVYNKDKMEYPINRFTMETKRQLAVLNGVLAENKYITGDDYTIADIAIFTWYGLLVLEESESKTFLNAAEEYPDVIRWATEVKARPAVQRGLLVNKVWGEGPQLAERHSAADIDKAMSA